MRKNNSNIISLERLLLLSMAISLGLHFAIAFSMWFSDGITFMHDANFHKPPFHFAGFISNLVFTFLLAFLVLVFNILIYKNKDFKPWVRMTIVIVGSIIITAVLSYAMTLVRPLLLEGPRVMPDKMPFEVAEKMPRRSPNQMKFEMFRNGLFRDFFTMVIALFSWQLIVMNHRRKEIAIENESLMVENMRARYEMLKNQMNPHFMFNSLNTLQGLITIDKEKAQEYLQELSKVLRYTLENKEVVTLKDELDFTNSYCRLMQIRYGDNLKINIDIDRRLFGCEILPLSLQILIENAIKHNVISDRQPLTIDVTSDFEAAIVFVNNILQRKIDAEPGYGIGLANLSERYSLKWGSNLEIVETEDNFKVGITLHKS